MKNIYFYILKNVLLIEYIYFINNYIVLYYYILINSN